MSVALAIQLAKRMRRLILSSVACPAVPVFSIDFQQILRFRFHENPSSGSGFIPCGRTDMTKLIDAFRNFANVRKMAQYSDNKFDEVVLWNRFPKPRK